MPKVTFLPDQKVVHVRNHTTVLQAAQKSRTPIRTRCGGNAGCLMCKIRITDETGLSPASEKESRKLGDLINQGYRLACQTYVEQDVEIQLPEDPLKAAIRAQLNKQIEEED